MLPFTASDFERYPIITGIRLAFYKLRIAMVSVLLIAGCTGQPPIEDNRAPSEKLSEGTGEVVGKAAEGVVNAVISFVPGLSAGVNAIGKQLENRANRAHNRTQSKLKDERDDKLFEFCTSNMCVSDCQKFILEELGIEPDCQATTNVVKKNAPIKPVVNHTLQPARQTESTDSTIVEHEGLRMDVYEVEGVEHVGIGSRVYGDVELKTSDDIVERFASDLDHAESVAKEFAGPLAWRRASVKQRSTLIEIAFALGKTGLNRFTRMRDYLQALDFNSAADELENSQWYKADTERVKTLASNLRIER